MTRAVCSPVALGLVLFVLTSAPLGAQRVSSDVLGTVTDASGAIVAGAKVALVHLETGQLRDTTSDESGRYHVAGLPPGTYDLRVERAGFAPWLRRGVPLLVNQQAVFDAVLQIRAIETNVTVSGAAILLDRSTAQLSSVVTSTTLRELPLNGRDLFSLTLLQPGVLPTTTAGLSPWSDGGITKAAVQGTRPTMNNITLDGGDINDPAYNLPPGGVSGTQLGVDAVDEFRVLLNGYSAEFGRNAGANVQLVTKSGGNELRGSVYEFHRDAALDARNYFDVGAKPPFSRDQFGVTLGGPLRRNHTFFFGNYEGLRERKSITSNFSVPDLNARRGLLPAAGNPTQLVNVGVDPRIAAVLSLFPEPNGESLGGGLAAHHASQVQPTDGHYAVARIDHLIGSHDQVFGRYVFDDSHATVPFMSTAVPGFPGRRVARNQYAMLSWQRVWQPSLVGETKFNFNRTTYLAKTANAYPWSISLVPNRALGSFNISGLPSVGNNLIYPLGSAADTIEVIENVSAQRGGHFLRFGGDVKRLRMGGPFDIYVNGEYLFSDLTAFGFPSVSANPPLEFFLKATPFLYIGVDPANYDTFRDYRQTYLGAYLQDDWHVRPHLTVNLGLRWEYWSNPAETQDRLSNIRDVLKDSAPTAGPLWARVPKDLWSPRVGAAWTLPGGRNVVRGGVGILRDQLWANLYGDTRFYEPYFRGLLFVLPSYQVAPRNVSSLVGLGGPPQVIGSFGMTYRPDFPYYVQSNVSVQRELGPTLVFQAAYAGSRGRHLPRGGEANPFVPALGRRLNPGFGSLPFITTDAESFYDSAQFSVQKRLSGGLTFQASYTLSKTTDDQSGPFPSDYVSESGVSQDFYSRVGDRGRASFDRRHAFVANVLYDLPFGPGRRFGASASPTAARILGGWKIGGILTWLSGAPFTANLGSFNNSGNFATFIADRPNVKSGIDPCDATLGRPDKWFDPTIFSLPAAGQYGNSGRNTLCGPDLRNFDLLIAKEIKPRARLTLQFRAEVFNLFNRANFDVPVNTQGPTGSGGNGDAIFIGRRTNCDPATDQYACGVLAPNVGRIFRTVTPSRQVQIGVKVLF